MSPTSSKQIFSEAVRFYKLTNRSSLNVLVPYKQFSLYEIKNSWPILWTSILLLLFNLTIILFCAGLFTQGKTPLIPIKDASGKADYGPPFVFGAALLFAIHISYKYIKALRLLWKLSKTDKFTAGFPSEIDIRKY